MATTVAALKGKLGSTEYYIIAMKAKELVEKAIIPSEMEGWDSLTLEEREQRDINYTRVRNQIAPYLAKDKDRFFGAIILTAKNLVAENFEPVGEMAKNVPNLYKTQSQLMGFLTFTGGEELIPLDGQHRLKAIQFAIEGKDEKSQKISGLTPSSALANEDVTVILVPYDTKKSRKIFTKVNRYAKPPTTGQNLVTDDDDFVAVSARYVANELITADLVKYKSNTLTDKDPYFTTLTTIASCNDAILKESFPPIDRTQPVTDSTQREMYMEKVEEVWTHLLENVEEFALMLSDKGEGGNQGRQEIRHDYLLGKPVPQWCLVKAFIKLTGSNKFSPKQATDKLNKIDWRKEAGLWEGLLVAGGGRLLYKNKNVAIDIIYYICGGKYDAEQLEELKAEYRKLFSPRSNKQLPDKV